MWRNSKDAFSLSLQKAFSATELPSPLQPEPRASFELSSDAGKEDLDVVRARLSQCGLASSSSPSNRQLQEQLGSSTRGSRKSASFSREERQAYDDWLRNYPSALGRMAECKAKLGGKRVAIFLDYDGTLTPIVANPDEAFLSQQVTSCWRRCVGASVFAHGLQCSAGRQE
ncbi:hypothetical protein DUNSADRAFT_4668 [Dunaliella salina]|uniref:Trehalose-6-phosphate phosphatase n=1 Tax=Dunaliella salina TaxID=3046 RepID=A0ABZ3L715_DUNSA|nr:hypothetical protein DUNSADRAFT_4668 [Dunaliella salina]|eukprot:KAF5837213.1 hypothetical protein DUNSADRAFT_4668 [Dunaliella salina]